MHHQLVGADRAEVISHTPHAVLAAHPALIGRIDHQRVVIQSKSLDRVHHFTDAVIHAARFGGDAAHRLKAVVERLVRVLPGVH